MSASITILTRLDGRPAGKTLTLNADGTIGKQVAGHSGRYSAQTHVLEGNNAEQILASYAVLLSGLEPSQCLVHGHVPGMGAAEYRIVPRKDLERQGLDLEQMHVIDGRPTLARLKAHFSPSRLALLDFDADAAMPAAWLEGTDSDRWALLTDALPELAHAARLVLPSSSGRIVRPDGSPAFSGAQSSHTYVVWERAPSRVELDALRVAVEVRLWAAGLGFIKQSASGANLRRCLIDSSVFNASREVFDAPPAVAGGLRLEGIRPTLHQGGTASLIAPATDEHQTTFTERTGSKVIESHDKRTGAKVASIQDHDTLRLYTRIETEVGSMTVAEFLQRPEDKLRCQATFRASTSWNGILRKHRLGAFLHDSGTGTTYWLGSDPDEIPSALGKAIKALESQSDANAHGYARAVYWRHAWRCPIQLSYSGLAKALHKANPAVDLEDLLLIAKHRASQGRATARRNVSINPHSLPKSVTCRKAHDVDEVYRGARDGGFHLLKAPHGIGKTEGVLKPLAKDAGTTGLVGIAPLVSLAGDMAHRFEVAHYHTSQPGETAVAICLHSIANPKYESAMDQARIVLVDEIARCVRACHDPENKTLNNGKGKAVWDQLGVLLRQARIAVGVDADLSTDDIRLLAELTGIPITVWEIEEAPRDITATFTHEDVAVADLEAAVAAGEFVLGYSDSANRIASLAAHLREQFPEKNIVAIHASKAISTAGTIDTERLLTDINGNVEGIDVLLMSPTVESGISLTLPHFTRHFGFYCGQLDPSQFNQGLLRDRTARAWTLAIMGNGFHSRPSSFGDMLNGLAASSRRVSALSNGEISIEPATAYDRACCTVAAESARARNGYGAELWHLLEHRGWQLKRGQMQTDKAGRAIRAEARVLLRNERAEAVLAADDVDAQELERLQAKRKHSPEESAQVARVDVRVSTGKVDEDLGADDVDLWQEGRLASQAQRLEDALADPGTTERDHVEAELGLPLSARHLDGARREAVAALFAETGINPADGSGEVTAESALAAFHALKASPHAGVLSRAGIAQFRKTPKYAVRWLNEVLAKLGLWLEGSGHDARCYRLAHDAKRTKAGELLLPGYALMAEVVNRRGLSARRCAYKESIAASAMCEPGDGTGSASEEWRAAA